MPRRTRRSAPIRPRLRAAAASAVALGTALVVVPVAQPQSAAAASTTTAWVMADAAAAGSKANIRSSPSYTATIVGYYGPHAKVTGTVSGTWLKTSKGYVSMGTLTTATSKPSTINGKIATANLCNVAMAYNAQHSFEPGYTPTTRRKLNCVAVRQLIALENAYKAKFGHYAQIDLAYRTLSEQWYWYDKFGSPRAAIPGTSNHGYALAVDFRENTTANEYSWGHAGNTWLLANSLKYGFVNPFKVGTTGEDYHFQFVG